MSTVKVALAGANGNLGPAVLKELLDAGHQVTVLTRSNSAGKFDARAMVTEVDYSSLDSLTAALTGHTAVVNTLGSIALNIHLNLIEAAVAANVQRFIPSEFGSNTTNANAAKLPVYANKVAIQQRLKELAQAPTTDFSYTVLCNGPFLDWGIKTGFLINLAGPTTEIFDGGDQMISTSTLPFVGRVVSAVLKNLVATKNKAVFVHETTVSQKYLIQLAGKEVNVKSVSTVELEKNAYEEMGKPKPNVYLFIVSFIKRCIFGEGFGSLFPEEELSNELLGLKTLSESGLKAVVSQYV